MTHTDSSWKSRGIGDETLAVLARELPASRLWSLLLEVMEQRAAQRTPSLLMEQWERDRFVQPAYIDQRTMVALDGHLFAAAAAFEAVELSPLAPLGVCSAVAPASQNKIVSAVRGTEIVSDPTNVLALECARRLRAHPEQAVRIASSHRCVRAQEVPKLPGFAAHFRMFCLVTAGKERQDHAFVVEALVQHIETIVTALVRLESHGYAFPDRKVTVFATPERAAAADRIAAAIAGAPVSRAVLEHPYYNGGLRYQISARSTQGTTVPLIDGGAFDWVAKLASNSRFVFVATGMGSQIVPFLYKAG